MPQVIRAEEPGAIDRAIGVLRQGALVAFPTDTVYGLGCLVDDAPAIERIFDSKGRAREKAIPVLLGDQEVWWRVSDSIPQTASALASHFWPGPLTIIVPRRADLPAILGPEPTIGVRVPNHGLARDLLRAAGPMAVTSANPSGASDPRTAQEVVDGLGERVDLVLDGGRTPGGIPSTVVDCTVEPARLARAGPISLAELRAVVAIRSGETLS